MDKRVEETAEIGRPEYGWSSHGDGGASSTVAGPEAIAEPARSTSEMARCCCCCCCCCDPQESTWGTINLRRCTRITLVEWYSDWPEKEIKSHTASLSLLVAALCCCATFAFISL